MYSSYDNSTVSYTAAVVVAVAVVVFLLVVTSP